MESITRPGPDEDRELKAIRLAVSLHGADPRLCLSGALTLARHMLVEAEAEGQLEPHFELSAGDYAASRLAAVIRSLASAE